MSHLAVEARACSASTSSFGSNATGEPLALIARHLAFAFSPDGRRLAYFAGRYASRRLYLRSLDRFEGEELASVEWGSTPFFSPDGNWVGFGTPTA